MTIFGQLVIGPPGSGKTTYCDGMSQFLRSLGRKVAIINIDPANDRLPYEAEISVSDLIEITEVMDTLKLGPNGGLVYCMEFLEKNFQWLVEKIKKLKDSYLIIDCPGQVELYTHNDSMKKIIQNLEKLCDARLCAVNLVDSHHCSDPIKFISVCLVSLNMMLQMELPHINILSKVDLIEKYGKLQYNIDFYTEVMDLKYLVDSISNDPFSAKFKKLNKAMTDLIQNYSLVSFLPLSIKSKENMLNIKNSVDKANGYCFGSIEERNMRSMMSSAMGGSEFEYMRTGEIREKYTDTSTLDLGNDLDKIDINPGFQI